MFKIVQVKKVTRAAKMIGRTALKPVDMIYVEAVRGFTSYGLNVHACGKVEFFRDSQYTLPAGEVFDLMMQEANKQK